MEAPDNVSLKQLQLITEAVRRYYDSAPSWLLPSKEDFADWLDTIISGDRPIYEMRGMTHCWGVSSFRRFVYERRGYWLDDFLKVTLHPDDFQVWLSL